MGEEIDAKPQRSARLVSATIGFLAALALIRLTVRDTSPISGPFYYFGQWIVIALGLTIAAALAWRQRRRRAARLCFAIAALIAGMWVWSGFRTANPSSAAADAPTLRVMCWNVASGRLGWAGAVEAIAAEDPDIVALVEAWPDRVDIPALLDRLNRRGQTWTATDQSLGLVLCTRGSLLEIESLRTGAVSAKRCRIALNGGSYDVIAADIPANPLRFRRAALLELDNIASNCAADHVILLGDFNTPPDSTHFAAIRARFRNAFEEVGDGYARTWPVPIPILTLDQIWHDKRLRAHACRTGWTPNSDHAWVLGEFSTQPLSRLSQ